MKDEFKFAGDRDHWERQPKEPDTGWAAFVLYRDMPPEIRSHAAVIKKWMGNNRVAITTVKAWAARWKWRERAAAWDIRKDHEKREADLHEIREMRERHIKVAKMMQTLGITELGKVVKRSVASKEEPVTTIREAVDIAERGVRLERLNRGEPESTHEEVQRTGKSWAELVEQAHRQKSALRGVKV